MPDPIASYKDLCIDATADPAATAAFWAGALAIGPVVDHDGSLLIQAPTRREIVWVNPVPEPKRVKNRMHLDIHCASIEELEALGARVLDRFERWTLMADPDGGEFDAFVREQVPAGRFYELALDCADPAAQARWWAGAIGGKLEPPDDGWEYLGSIPDTPFEGLTFAPVPEPKSGPNRVHIDVLADDIAALVDHGAVVLRPQGGDIRWTVMADPEGNEFCVFLR